MKDDFLNIGFISDSNKLEVQIETVREGINVSIIWLPKFPHRKDVQMIVLPFEEFADLVGESHWMVKKVRGYGYA